ncbi:MAG: RNA pyrophosphohydrolase [Gammaproteobacteria bacterium]|nr:RNA pyrophosphohydrolase [Gammaproteobacteria bacterium]MCY4358400.1 RNA pyrophosphohydrolase [Gammaproteobacteria bacterium]
MIDSEGYRPNVGIVICNREGKVFWAKRVGQSGWQFPQGGIQTEESLKQALYRELNEEVGLRSKDVELLYQSNDWLHYRLPEHYIRYESEPKFVGQKQVWFLLGLKANEEKITLNRSRQPEFDDWCWVDYWYPVDQVVEFKREVYKSALQEMLTPFNMYTRQQ